MSALSGFNNVLIKFLDKILKWYPDLKDIKTIRSGIETLKKYNPRLVLDEFMGYIGKYYIEIFNKKEEFFTELSNLQHDPNFCTIGNADKQQSIMAKMGIFNDLWKDMPDVRKIFVWKMFGILIKAGALGSNFKEYKIILEYAAAHPELFNK